MIIQKLLSPMLLVAFAATGATQEADAAAAADTQGAEWMQDFEAARQKAKADGLDLLVDFTGSDWCVWCKRLDAEVFEEAAFQQQAPKQFVLVKLDFPRDKTLVTDEIRAQNQQLQEDYKVQGFPTIFLLDASGRPYAQTGYQPGGAEGYLEHLATLKKAKAARDEHFQKAEGVEGLEQARELAKGLEAMDDQLVLAHYRKEIDKILAIDADDAAGLKSKFGAKVARAEIEQKFQELAQEGKWDEVDALMVDTLAKYKGQSELEQMATFYRAVVALEKDHDFTTALKMIDDARAIDPDSELGQRLVRIRGNIERMQKQQAEEEGGKKDGGN